MYSFGKKEVMVVFSAFIVITLFRSVFGTFSDNPLATGINCTGESRNLRWVYDETGANPALIVEWKQGVDSVLTWVVTANSYTYGAGYSVTKVSHDNTNGEITLLDLTTTNSGTYICEVTYTLGSVITSQSHILTVFDYITIFNCTFQTGMIDCQISDHTVPVQVNGTTRSLPYTPPSSGTYEVCMTGDAAICSSVPQCQIVDVGSSGARVTTDSTTEISTDVQTTTLEITSSTTKDIMTNDKKTTTRIAESTTVQTMVTNTVTKPISHGLNVVDLSKIYFWCSVFAIGIFILIFYGLYMLYVKHKQSPKTVQHAPASTENTAHKQISKPIESYSKTKRQIEYQNIHDKDSFKNTAYDHGKPTNKKHKLSSSQFQHESSYKRSYQDRSLGSYRPQMSMNYVNKVYSPEREFRKTSKQHATYLDNDFIFYRGSHLLAVNKVNVNNKTDNSYLYTDSSHRLEIHQNYEPELYY